MKRLRELIEDTGFASFYLALTPGNLRAAQWKTFASALSGNAKKLAEFFLLGDKIALVDLHALITPGCASTLVAAGIVAVENGSAKMGTFRLLCWEGIFFFAEISFKPNVYYGTDSLALNVHHSYLPGKRALDLCAGPGIQALTLARRGFTVDAIELSLAAIAVGRVNVSLNGLEGKVVYYHADVAEFVQSQRRIYDVVVMNPPLLPISAELNFPFVGDGGEDGQNLAKTVLENSRNLLANDRSRLVFVGLTPERRGNEVVIGEYLQRLCVEKDLSAILFLLGRHPAAPGNMFFDAYVHALQLYNTGDPDAVLIKVAEYLRRTRIQFMDQYVAIVSPGSVSLSRVTTNDFGALGVQDWFSG